MRSRQRLFAVLAIGLATTLASAGPFDSWACRAQVTFAGYTRSETLTNVPMLVVLGPASIAGFDYGQFLSGANADLRFTDAGGATELSYEIEKWDATGSSYVWVQVPQLSGAATAVRAYWGMAGQSTPAYTTSGATWTNGYVGVWHMNAATCPESTTNHWPATASNVTLTNGQAGSALTFNGTSSSVLLTNVFGAAGGRFTAEILARTTNNANSADVRLFDSWAPGCRLIFSWNIGSIGKCAYYSQANYYPSAGAGAALTNGNWQYVAYVLDQPSNTGRVYQAGSQVGSGAFATTNFGASASATNYLGRSTTSAGNWFPGAMDEFRISTVLRSTNWLWACWMNMTSNALFDTSATLAATPVIVSQPASGIWDTWANMNASLTSTGLSTTAVFLYWGLSDGNTNAANWAHTNAFGTVSGTCPIALSTNITGLTASTSYTYRYFATNTDGSIYWSAPQTFTTLSTVTAPTVNTSAGALITPAFTATLRGQVTGGSPAPAVYVCWGTANAGTSDTSAWQHVDSVGTTSGSFGDAISGLTSNTTYYYACFATNAMGAGWSAVASFVDGTNTTWTGGAGGTGTSWNNAANWSTGFVPGPNDTVLFGSSGLTNSKTVALDASQTVYCVTIATVTNFTIGAASDTNGVLNTLTLTTLNRQRINGSEGVHILGAPVAIAPDGNTNSVWFIDGGNYLRLNGNLSATTSTVTMVKAGAGQLNMNYGPSPSFGGTWNILAGSVTESAQNAFKASTVYVGGTTSPATFSQSAKNDITGNMNITVWSNGTFSSGDIDSGRVNSILVSTGGVASIGTYFYCCFAYLRGGVINGGQFYNGGYNQCLRSYAADRTAIFNCTLLCSSYYDAFVSAEDGPPAIDLDILGSISSSAKMIRKQGAGTVVFEKSTNHFNSDGTNSTGFSIEAGTALFNNPSGSGCGMNPMLVSAGATIGGTGFLGGVTAETNANITLSSGTSTNSMATISPGTVDTNTGVSLIGTLTVGSASRSNNVTFGKFTRLYAQLGTTPGSCDRLAVNGYLNLGGPANTNYLDVDTLGVAPKGGDYTVATFGGLTGRFTFVRSAPGALLPNHYTVNYLGTPTGNGNELANGSIVVHFEGVESVILVR